MIQSSAYWIWLFATALVIWWLPQKLRLGFLGLACLGYLACVEFSTTLILSVLTFAFFWIPRVVGQDRFRTHVVLYLVLGILGYLFYYKFRVAHVPVHTLRTGATASALPLGISYFTFKFIHYAIEVGRGNLKPHGFGDFLAYMTLVPIFTAGPIERFDHFLANHESAWSLESLVAGLTRIIHGLIKRFVVAGMLVAPLLGPFNNGAQLIDSLDQVSAFQLWRYCIVTFLLWYLDFSAYSDIAIGGARLFGLRIMENFNWPIFAPNIVQFWKRWHMTLAGWCLTYVYMPGVGLTRSPYFSTYATFFVIGVWHGVTLGWVLWGLYHATGIAFFMFWNQIKRRLKWRIPEILPLRILSTVMTVAFVSAGGLLPALEGRYSPWIIIRVFGKLLFLDMP